MKYLLLQYIYFDKNYKQFCIRSTIIFNTFHRNEGSLMFLFSAVYPNVNSGRE